MSSAVYSIREHTIPASHIREYARATSTSQNTTLSLHVKQYTPKSNPNPRNGDVTIIGSHANGFPKEVYEPLWDDLYHALNKKDVRIKDIWILDAAWQGRSSILNEGKLGNDPSWLDYARDILQMINTFRMPRPIIAVGHSFGANALVNVSIMHPRLFTTLILLDPTISRYASTPGPVNDGPAARSIYRRDVWPSRQAAIASFNKSPFYQSWDKRALEKWTQFGLRSVPGQPNGEEQVTLSTTKHQEVFTYLRPSWPAYDAQGKQVVRPEHVPDLDHKLNETYPSFPLYRPEGANTVDKLPNVRPSVLYVFGGKSDLSPKSLQDEKMALTGSGVGGSGGRALGRVKSLVGQDYGHLIPLEAPEFCAVAAANWIGTEMETWRLQEAEYGEWTRLPEANKILISEEYKQYAGKPSRQASKAKI